MKKKLESELVSIAHRILKLKGKEDIIKMHAEVTELFEKLSVLKFAHENFEGDIPTIGSDSSFFGMLDQAFNNKVSDNIEFDDKVYINLDDAEHDDIMEHGIKTIKDMVAFMPEDAEDIDTVFEEAIPKPEIKKTDLEDITAGFKEMPIFEPVLKSINGFSKDKKSLNDKLNRGGLHIGLNDKIAFIKHLFNGKSEDYERVLSQLSTFNSLHEATHFIQNIVKLDYNNWEGKEEFEARFMIIVEAKFE